MEELNNAAAELYSAVLDSRRIEAIPRRLSRLCGSDTAVLLARRGDRTQVLAHNLSESADVASARDLLDISLELEALSFARGTNDVTASRRATREGEVHCLGALMGRPEPVGALALHRRAGAGPFPDQSVRVLESLLPHLSRAMEIRDRLANGGDRARLAERALDRLALGVIELDGEARVILANRAAEQILDAKDGLRLDQGRLEADPGEAGRRLRAAVAAASRGRLTGGMFQITRPSGLSPYSITVSNSPDVSDAAQGHVMALIDDGERAAAEAPARLARLFGLTAAEAKLAAALCDGLCLKDIAEARGVKMTTVRTQAQRVLDKAGVSRQAELVALAARAPALLAPRD